MFLTGPWAPVNLLKVGAGRHWPPHKLLAPAKSDENERRLRVRDLTRLEPEGPATSFC